MWELEVELAGGVSHNDCEKQQREDGDDGGSTQGQQRGDDECDGVDDGEGEVDVHFILRLLCGSGLVPLPVTQTLRQHTSAVKRFQQEVLKIFGEAQLGTQEIGRYGWQVYKEFVVTKDIMDTSLFC